MMIPPLQSSTLNSEDVLGKSGQSGSAKNQNTTEGGETGGRPKKDVTELSDKTLANQESMD